MSKTAWWLASKSKNMPVAMRCQTNNQFRPDNPQHKPGSPWENWSLPTTSQLHLFCTAWSLPGKLRPKLWFLRSCLCCRDVGQHGPNNKHNLEEHVWHVGSTTSTEGPSRVARLGWLPRQTNLPLHGGWRRKGKICVWPWNVKSTIS